VWVRPVPGLGTFLDPLACKSVPKAEDLPERAWARARLRFDVSANPAPISGLGTVMHAMRYKSVPNGRGR